MFKDLITRAYADAANTPLVSPLQKNTDLNNVFGNVVNIISLVAGIMAFVYLVYSGILYITAAGNEENAKKGQQGIINAVIGIVVIVAAWLIVSAVSSQANSSLNNGI